MVDLDLTAAGGGEKDAHIDVTLFPNGMSLSPCGFPPPHPPPQTFRRSHVDISTMIDRLSIAGIIPVDKASARLGKESASRFVLEKAWAAVSTRSVLSASQSILG